MTRVTVRPFGTTILIEKRLLVRGVGKNAIGLSLVIFLGIRKKSVVLALFGHTQAIAN